MSTNRTTIRKQSTVLPIVVVYLLIDERALPLPNEIRREIGYKIVAPLCHNWTWHILKLKTTCCANPLPELPFATCFQLWCGRTHLEQITAYSTNVSANERLLPLNKRRAETLILLGNDPIYRSFNKEGYMD